MSTLKDPSVYIQEIVNWLQLGGGFIHPAVEIVHSDDATGYSLRVRKDHNVPEGSRIISCPRSLTISVLSMGGAENLWPEEFMSFFTQFPEVLTRFFLMEQFLIAEDSFWHPYIRMLPQPADDALDTPMFYSPEDCLWIQGTNLEGTRKVRQEQWKQEYEKALDLLKYNDIARYELLSENWRELYVWAATILTSRCFSSNAFAVDKVGSTPDLRVSIENQGPHSASPSSAVFPVLLPVLDFSNHDPSAGVYWKMQGSSYSFIVNETLQSGREICISYDNKGNEELIMGYGFSLFNNTKDAFRLLLRSTSTSQSLAKARSMQQELQKQQIQSLHQPNAPHAQDESPTPKHTPSDACTANSPPPCGWSPDMFFLQPASSTTFLTTNRRLVDTFSILVANARELRTLHISPTRISIPSPSPAPTHNLLRLTSALLTELQRKTTDITSHTALLPPYPSNTRQFHAARYRRSQLHILATNTHALRAILRAAHSPTTRLVRLADVLAKPPATALPNPLRAAVHRILGTRHPRRIHAAGHEDLSALGGGFDALLHRWLACLETAYGAPPFPLHGPVAHRVSATATANEDDDEEGEDDDERRETALIAASYLAVVRAVAETAAAGSVFADARWSEAFLAWGLRVVQEEGVVLPGAVGEEGEGGLVEEEGEEEFVVFVGEW
ncbi:hypothetical protein MMC11_002421 [Xylographa trunciseda]|nr:hypothetical protein [Xylographa trunciseda]